MIKWVYLFYLIFACAGWQANAESPAEAISALRKEPSAVNLINAGEWLRGWGRFQKRPKEFFEIQALMLAAPGHAQAFADEVERYRASPANSQDRYNYSRYRYWYLVETLKHLPSPETIKVLGHYLSDDRDPVKLWDDAPPPPENSKLACVALSAIGLKNSPPVDSNIWEVNPEPWRQWYARIQSGELAFSFVGHDVEYRFSPDGSVQATELHKTAEELVAETLPPPKPRPSPAPAPPAVATPPTPPSSAMHWIHLWPWLAGVVGILAGLAAWRQGRKGNAHGST